jgi:hypothetical protein
MSSPAKQNGTTANGHSKAEHLPHNPSRRFERVKRLVVVSVVTALLSALVRSDRPTYAVCSPGEGAIYTVDETNPQVQCIVVQGGRVRDLGSLGQWDAQLHIPSLLSKNIASS